MALLFFGTDPKSGGGNCPAVWVDTDTAQGPELVLQGKFADAMIRAACSQDSPPADDEGIVRIPLSMVEQIRRACDAAEAVGTQLCGPARLRPGPRLAPGAPRRVRHGEEREVYDAFLRDGSVPADDSEF
ncbi:hypothetical protein [Streptomyces sp. NPDC004435]|uniref:hypothetical protein n=1 Tax=unclassified Streptomyces TaxID=2593676 RepID=UPI00367B674E